MKEKYYTYTKIDGAESEVLLLQVRDWVANHTIENHSRDIDNIKIKINSDKIIDGGTYN
jgi:hypothetical protein